MLHRKQSSETDPADWFFAAADRLRALGLDPAALAALDDSAVVSDAAPGRASADANERSSTDSTRTP